MHLDRSLRVLVIAPLFILGNARLSSADELTKEACVEAHSKGQDAREQGKLALARTLFLSCAQAACPALVQGDCARFADDVTRLVPSVGFVARDAAGVDLPDTAVYLDGMLVVTRLDDGKVHDLDPGKHTFAFKHGARTESVTVVVGAGEKGRTIVATFRDLGGSGDPTTPGVDRNAGAAPRTRAARVTTHPAGAKLLLGLGAAMVAGGGALGVLGLSRVPDNCSTSSHRCAAPPGDPSFAAATSALKLSNLGWTIGATGVAAVVGGLVWYAGGKRTSRDERLVAPWFTAGGGGLALTGRM